MVIPNTILEKQISSEDKSINMWQQVLILIIITILIMLPLQTLFAQVNSSLIDTSSSNSAMQEFSVPVGSRPHDVAPGKNGSVWYTSQGSGELGLLDPSTGKSSQIALGQGSAPHGVIVGPDGAPWVTDGGLNAIVRADPKNETISVFPLPNDISYANLNTATFDHSGILWFTGQSGIYGQLNPFTKIIKVNSAPRGAGPYGISTTPTGAVYFASLAGGYIGLIDVQTGNTTVLEPPTPDQGARRIWPDSHGRVWFSEWNSGKLGLYDPAIKSWHEWQLPGKNPKPYAIFVDDKDMIWLSDFASNALVRFDPSEEKFQIFPLLTPGANVRQLLGRPGEIWGAESAVDKLVLIRTNGTK
jgi:virginiamycin B lyase